MARYEYNAQTGALTKLPDLLPDPAPALTQAQLLAVYTAALDAHYDSVAQSRNYDNRITCALRAGYTGPFQAEGQAFALWMDTCNLRGYELLNAVLAGERELPAVEAFIADLPALVWPSSPSSKRGEMPRNART